MSSYSRKFRPSRIYTIGLLSGAGLALLLAGLWWLLREPSHGGSIESVVHVCADLFEAREFEALSEYAWPASERESITKMLEQSVPQGFSVERPINVTSVRTEGDKSIVGIEVKWSMAMGRVRDNARLSVTMLKREDKWFVDADSMKHWRP